MSKLRLDLDALQVDSFGTETAADGRGTVYGRIDTVGPGPGTTTLTGTFQTGPTCPECPYTYPRTLCRVESFCLCQTPTDTTAARD